MMPSDLPIACSLSASEMSGRMAEIASLGRAAIVSAAVDGAHAVLRFRVDGDIRQRLATVVAAEAECCAFLDLHLRDDSEATVLTIDGPPDAEPIVRELVAAVEGRS